MPKEIRTEETKIFTCHICGQPIRVRLPRRLKGFFAHFRCEYDLDATFIEEVLE